MKDCHILVDMFGTLQMIDADFPGIPERDSDDFIISEDGAKVWLSIKHDMFVTSCALNTYSPLNYYKMLAKYGGITYDNFWMNGLNWEEFQMVGIVNPANHPDLKWDTNYLVHNENIPLARLETYPDFDINDALHRSDMTLDFALKHADNLDCDASDDDAIWHWATVDFLLKYEEEGKLMRIFRHPAFTVEDYVEQHRMDDTDDFLGISLNPNVTLADVREYYFINWNAAELAINPAFNWTTLIEIYFAYPDVETNIKEIFCTYAMNPNVTWRELKEIAESEPELNVGLFNQFRYMRLA
jgi:hypothetical protein